MHPRRLYRSPVLYIFLLVVGVVALVAVDGIPEGAIATVVEESPAAGRAALFDEAARAAFAYLQAHRQPETGLVKATSSYGPITTWDVASVMAGVHAASELDLHSRSDAERWLGQIIRTMASADVYGGVAFNKAYAPDTGAMLGSDDRPSRDGRGWSAVDLGRLLVWLRIVAQEYPDLAEHAANVESRLDYDPLVRDGRITGHTFRKGSYPEGGLGYEQYAARGFQLWGQDPFRSLELGATETVEIHGQPLRVRPGDDKLTSEPFVLMGMELGWTPEMEEMARQVLAVQEARWRETGTVTMASEDAVHEPPYYFYYYSLWADGEPFVVRAQGPLDEPGPRWVSTKAAYAWHALVPDDYTALAVETVRPARHRDGWASGVFEGSNGSTAVRNLNTAAVVLEAALYDRLGRPFLTGR